jgi:putative transposase
MRKPRQLQYGASYHVVSRVNRKEVIFKTPEIQEMFMEVIRRAKKKYRFTIKNFCIMGNHYHFIIKPLNNESLSAIMQWVLSVFAMQYNKTFGLTGHVWNERFKSKIIHSFLQYLATFVYIANNPVRAKMVQYATDYKYSGMSLIYKGQLDILERPPNDFLRRVWMKLR